MHSFVHREKAVISLLTYIHTYLLTYLLTYLFTYLLTYLLNYLRMDGPSDRSTERPSDGQINSRKVRSCPVTAHHQQQHGVRSLLTGIESDGLLVWLSSTSVDGDGDGDGDGDIMRMFLDYGESVQQYHLPPNDICPRHDFSDV